MIEGSTMRVLFAAIGLGVLVAVLAACAEAGGAGGSPASSSDGTAGTGGTIEGPTWRLTSLTERGTATDVPGGVVVDATFVGGRVAGSGGCNVYNPTAVIAGATIKVGSVASTAIGCPPPASEVEAAYLRNLANASTFTANGDALTIFDASGAAILGYAAAPANPLEGAWIVTGYNNGQEAVVSPVAGTTLTAVFTDDAVSGDAGCNDYNGGYTLDGRKVAIGPLASTQKACDQPVMDQEAQFLTALQTPATVEVSGATVTLRSASGAMLVVLAPKP
jgi:heat shock protein HslJ